MSQQSTESYRILENVIFLKKAQLFSSVKTSDLRSLAGIAEECVFDAGEAIVREDDVGDSMYIIKQGTVTIVKNAEGNATITLARLSPGDCFGDMAVFDAEVRSASVKANERCVLLRVNRDGLIDAILDSPHMAIELLKTFVKRLRQANQAIKDLTLKRQADRTPHEQKGQLR